MPIPVDAKEIKAAKMDHEEGNGITIMLGNRERIEKMRSEIEYENEVEIIDLSESKHDKIKDKYAKTFVELRKHKGLSFLDVLQPCPTYNDVNTRDWYAGVDLAKESMERHSRIYKLEDTKFDPTVNYAGEVEVNEKLSQALVKSLEWGDKIPIGVFYQNELVSPFSTRLTDKIPNYLENPPAKQVISDAGLPNTDISKILDSLKV